MIPPLACFIITIKYVTFAGFLQGFCFRGNGRDPRDNFRRYLRWIDIYLLCNFAKSSNFASLNKKDVYQATDANMDCFFII